MVASLLMSLESVVSVITGFLVLHEVLSAGNCSDVSLCLQQ